MINKMLNKLIISSEEATKMLSTAIHQEVRNLLAGHIEYTHRHFIDLQAIKDKLKEMIRIYDDEYTVLANRVVDDLQELIGADNEITNN